MAFHSQKILSICSGVGALDLGVRLAVPGSRTVCYIEREIYSAAVLAARMRDGALDTAPVWSDLPRSMAARGAARWILSLAVSPASPGRLPGTKKASQMIAGSGVTSSGSFARWRRRQCFWKMSLGSARVGSGTSSARWPRWGTMRNGACFQRLRPEHRNAVTGSSSMVRWLTPTVFDSSVKFHPSIWGNLTHQSSIWMMSRGRFYSHRDLRMKNVGEKYRGRRAVVNPRFSTWLMGLPDGWANAGRRIGKRKFAQWETASSRLLSRLLSGYCGGV